jgi:hypothetical protein
MAAKPEKIMTDLCSQALDTFESAMKSGIKAQEEMADWWSQAMGKSMSPEEMQKKFQEMGEEAIPMAKKNAEAYLKVMDQGCKDSIALLRQAFESGQSESVTDLQHKTQELWEQSLAAVRHNTEAMIQANTRAMEAWSKLAEANGGGPSASA